VVQDVDQMAVTLFPRPEGLRSDRCRSIPEFLEGALELVKGLLPFQVALPSFGLLPRFGALVIVLLHLPAQGFQQARGLPA
jgi:hypothetical protein